jgi:hypothetical protein
VLTTSAKDSPDARIVRDPGLLADRREPREYPAIGRILPGHTVCV